MILAPEPPIEDTPGPGDPTHDCLDPSAPTWEAWCGDLPGPTVAGYGGTTAGANPDLQGKLPFTGLDVVLLLTVAAMLFALGAVLRLRRG